MKKSLTDVKKKLFKYVFFDYRKTSTPFKGKTKINTTGQVVLQDLGSWLGRCPLILGQIAEKMQKKEQFWACFDFEKKQSDFRRQFAFWDKDWASTKSVHILRNLNFKVTFIYWKWLGTLSLWLLLEGSFLGINRLFEHE